MMNKNTQEILDNENLIIDAFQMYSRNVLGTWVLTQDGFEKALQKILTIQEEVCPNCVYINGVKVGRCAEHIKSEGYFTPKLTAQEGESDRELVSILEDAGYEVVEGYEKVKQLIGVAKTAHNLADDTKEENGVYTITKDNADELGKVLDKLELPTPPKEGE